MAGRPGFKTNSPHIKAFRVMALDALSKQHARYLLKHRALFPDFWRQYCKAYEVKPIDLENSKDERTKAIGRLKTIKYKHNTDQNTTTTIAADNYVIYHVTDTVKQKAKDNVVVKTKKKVLKHKPNKSTKKSKGPLNIANQSAIPELLDCEYDISEGQPDLPIEQQAAPKVEQKEVTTIQESTTGKARTLRTQRIESRKISEISFASPITVSTVSRIEEFAKFKEYFAKDYLYFLSGGTEETEVMKDGRIRKRFKDQLRHIEQSRITQDALSKLTDNLLVRLDGGEIITSEDRKSFDETLSILKKAMDHARKTDLEPIAFINSIEEGEFSAQKALQGAIMNDKAMVENGNIVLEQIEAQKIHSINIDSDIKKIGEALLNAHVDSLNHTYSKEETSEDFESEIKQEDGDTLTIENNNEEQQC